MIAFIRRLSNVKSDLAGEAEIYLIKKRGVKFSLLNGFCLETATVNLTGNTLADLLLFFLI